MIWITANLPAGSPHVPEWVRSAAYDEATGTAYVPAAMLGNETEILLCVSYDGVSIIVNDDHPYVPSTWAAKEYPKHAETIAVIEARLKEEAARASGTVSA